jgi:hypothetical protein
MTALGCSDVLEDLPWLANQSLSPARRRILWEHLSHCTSCRADLVTWLTWAKTAARGLPALDPAILDPTPVVPSATVRSGRIPHPNPVGPPLTVVGQMLAWAAARALAEQPGT